MVKMTKRGSLDNEVTNEFICDATADLALIDRQYVTLGSVALVLEDMQAYIANSQGQWLSMTPTSHDEEEEEEQQGGGGE